MNRTSTARAMAYAATAATVAAAVVALVPSAAADTWTTTDQTHSTIAAASPTEVEPPLTPGNLVVRPWITPPNATAVRAAVALAAARPATARATAHPSRRPQTRRRPAHATHVTAPHRIQGEPPAQVTPWRVRPGDTLSAIAFATGTSVPAIAEANGLDDPNRIQAGSVLRIPARGAL